jgi:hypothetical protein
VVRRFFLWHYSFSLSLHLSFFLSQPHSHCDCDFQSDAFSDSLFRFLIPSGIVCLLCGHTVPKCLGPVWMAGLSIGFCCVLVPIVFAERSWLSDGRQEKRYVDAYGAHLVLAQTCHIEIVWVMISTKFVMSVWRIYTGAFFKDDPNPDKVILMFVDQGNEYCF